MLNVSSQVPAQYDSVHQEVSWAIGELFEKPVSANITVFMANPLIAFSFV